MTGKDKNPYFHHLSVLIAEDDVEVAQNLQLYLSGQFKKVDIAHTGNNAFEKYLNYTYDLLLTDIEMPFGNGIELCQRVRKLDKNIPIILFSGHTQESYLLELVTLKIDDYIIKPVTSLKIDNAIIKVLHNEHVDVAIICKKHDIFYSYRSKSITCKELVISLTHFEIIMIELFLSHKSYKISHDVIFNALYEEENGSKNGIKNLIKRLRHKLPHMCITSIPRYGYQLQCPEETNESPDL